MRTSRRSTRRSAPPSGGLTLDSGALVALERREPRALALIATTARVPARVTVPAAVLAEWWRDDPRQHYVRSLFAVEATTEDIAKRAGIAIGRLRRKEDPARRPKARVSAVDAIVMASAAARGDVVFTSDPDDLRRLSASFPNVTILRL
jgi:predicted nucleic acid-binding protein